MLDPVHCQSPGKHAKAMIAESRGDAVLSG